jgi:hypothetical protein
MRLKILEDKKKKERLLVNERQKDDNQIQRTRLCQRNRKARLWSDGVIKKSRYTQKFLIPLEGVGVEVISITSTAERPPPKRLRHGVKPSKRPPIQRAAHGVRPPVSTTTKKRKKSYSQSLVMTRARRSARRASTKRKQKVNVLLGIGYAISACLHDVDFA